MAVCTICANEMDENKINYTCSFCGRKVNKKEWKEIKKTL